VSSARFYDSTVHGFVERWADRAHALDRGVMVQLVRFARLLRLPRLIVGGALTGLGVLGVLSVTGWLDDTYAWLERFFQPGVWEAMATWVTAAIAGAAFVYAKRQVQEAKQARIAQENQSRASFEQQAELSREALNQQAAQFRKQMAAQAKIAQKALDHDAEQAQRTRDEMAQPNVVMYPEPNPTDWQILEVVIKNFGDTPAYSIVPSIEPPLQTLPNNPSNGELYEIPIPPLIPILAPGQEWRTFWDSAVERRQKEREIRDEIIGNWPGGPPTGTDFAPLVAERMPRTQHTGNVTYWDSRGNSYETKAVLDFEMLKGSMRQDIRDQ
jgi:hypothetical protein